MGTSRHNSRARHLAIAIAAAVLLNQSLGVTHAQTAGPNLLDNADFNWPEQKNPDVCAPEWIKHNAVTPRGWTPYWACKSDEEKNQDKINREPEFRPMNADITEQKPRVRSYPTAASFFNFYSLQRSAGLVQVVKNVTPGARLRFSIWTQLWTTNVDRDNSNFEPGGLQARACIDTSGVTTAQPKFSRPEVVCGQATRTYDQYVQISVEATAAASQVTVIFDTSADYPVKHNDVFADDAELVVIGGAAAAPAPAAAQSSAAQAPAAAQATAPSAPAPAGAAPAVTVKIASANVRSSPSYSGAIIGTANQGTTFPATAVTADKQWFQIQTSAGLAFIHGSVVVPNGAAQAALNGTAAPVAPVPAAAAAAPAAPVPAAPASVDSLPVIPAAPGGTVGEAAVIANTGTSRLLVRAQPSATGRVLARVASGTRFTVLGVSPDKRYWKVAYPGAADGAWVMVAWTTSNEAAQAQLR